MVRTTHLLIAALFSPLLASGCSAPVEQAGQSEDAILGGTLASSHPEAVLVDMYQGSQEVAVCSGALIAPKVVLTAGHCVYDITSWVVTTPPSGASAVGVSGATYDWNTDSEYVDPSLHDIGLVFLKTPIQLTTYPWLSRTKLPQATPVTNLGRVKYGVPRERLYIGPAIPVYDAKPYGFPFDYISTAVIESGDSGGPVELANVSPPVIVAVNSGGDGTQVLARVDLLESWITSQVAAHGGFGTSGGFVSLTTK